MSSFETTLLNHQRLLERLVDFTPQIESACHSLILTLKSGGKILLCGNGGSAADCQHIAAELMVRYQKSRMALPAIALTTDSSILTAQSNDFGYEFVFSRQLEALARPGDCLIAISTSGNSPNILRAIQTAQNKQIEIVGLTGSSGGAMKKLLPGCIQAPSDHTALIQQSHMLIAHWWCEQIEREFA